MLSWLKAAAARDCPTGKITRAVRPKSTGQIRKMAAQAIYPS